MYIEIDKVKDIFFEIRKKDCEIYINKVDGTPRELVGVMCYREDRNIWLVNEGDEETPHFRQVNLSRVKKVVCGYKTWTSEGLVDNTPSPVKNIDLETEVNNIKTNKKSFTLKLKKFFQVKK